MKPTSILIHALVCISLVGCSQHNFKLQSYAAPECTTVELVNTCVLKDGKLDKKCRFRVHVNCPVKVEHR